MPSRRRLLAAAGGMLAALASSGAVDAGRSRDAGPDWPMARYNPAGTGYNPRASGPRDGVRIKWQREPDGFSGATASPILHDGTLYATGGVLLALDATTGETAFVTEGSYRSSPARADAKAYATDTLAVTAPQGVYGLNAEGGIRLLGSAFGTERWHGPGREPGFSVFGPPAAVPPVAVGGTVYAAVPGTGHVVALEASSGQERWRRSPGDELRRPAVRNGVVFAVNWPHRASAYDADTGEERWQRDLDEQMVLAPTATEDGVVVPRRSGVTYLDAGDGSVRWRFDHDGNATEGAAAVAEGRVFVMSDGEDGSLHAIDLDTGAERWSASLRGEGTPVVADGVVYVSTLHNELVALDAATGAVRWRYESRLPLSTPAVGDGVLYVVSHGRVLALEEAR